jgi:acetylornithine/succinyldiaminopimelate/putrescine aminotransferase
MVKSKIKNLQLSLSDLVGKEYIESVCKAKAFIENKNIEEFYMIANEKIDFFPNSFAKRIDELVDMVGKKVTDSINKSSLGAATNAFANATKFEMAPLSSLGFIRIGENGKAYLIAKSEHYHAPLGHSFPGYKLIENAKKLGIPNATHNNTRGHITRLLETELIRVANGISINDNPGLMKVLKSSEGKVINRVINLETGSLAVEAALKMMLSRFYRLDSSSSEPKYYGKIPVFIVIADNNDGKDANYHGTTILTQMLRGMWPDLYSPIETNKIFRIQQVEINDIDDFLKKTEKFNSGQYKIAGFFHEIILMNYGGILLEKKYLQNVYQICKEKDIPIIVDEIQSCLWSPSLFMFKEYELKPDFVSVGKGFPGGEYPASRLLTNANMDNLNLFGALVTNGQEELASLAYLITMRFAEENKQYSMELGDYYENQIRELRKKYRKIVTNVEGNRHLTTLFFRSKKETVGFVSFLNNKCIDISAQTYKENCSPSALTKIPIISSYKMVDFIITNMDAALRNIK